MAAPPTLTTLDTSGTFVLNKTLTDIDALDEILRLQGVSWITRTVIYRATITLDVKHYKDDEGVEHIDIDQTLSLGGIKTTELRTLDWQRRERNDNIFGHVIGQSRRVQLADIEDEYLRSGWTSDTAENGAIESYVESDTPKSGTSWIAHQIWGFEDIKGDRRYVRHVKFTDPNGEDIQTPMIYDFVK